MANHVVAPTLLAKGKELWDKSECECGKLIVDNKIMYAAYQLTGSKSKTQFGLMMFLLGCAQNGKFSVPAKTVEDRMGIGDKLYYKVLKELQDLELIEWEKGKSITIRYDTLWKYSTDVEYSPSEESTDGEYSTSEEYSTYGEYSPSEESSNEKSPSVDYWKMF